MLIGEAAWRWIGPRLISMAMMSCRILRVAALTAGLLLCVADTVLAQTAAPVPVSTDELQKLVNTLKDDKARAALVGELQALIAAQRNLEQTQAQENPATLLSSLSQQLDAISSEILDAATVVFDAPRLAGWIDTQVSDAQARARWLSLGFKLGIVFGVALLGEWVLRLLLRRPSAHLGSRSSDALAVRLLLMAMQFIVEALPVVAFVGIAYVVLPMVQARVTSSHVAEVIIDATLTARLILAAARVLLLSSNSMTLYELGEETRNYLYIWVRRFTNWAVYGFALSTVSWWLGVPGSIFVLLLRGAILVLAILAVVFILQNRAAVAEALRGKSRPAGADGSEPSDRSGWLLLRQRVADTWHLLAIAYIAATFGAYVVNIQGGFVFVFRATLLSIVIAAGAGLVVRSVRRLSQRGFAIGADLKSRFPTLETRANRYLPLLNIGVAIVVYFFAALTVLQAWGIAAFAWFDTNFGRRFTGSLISILTVLIVSLVLWEFFGSAVERYLNGIGRDGQPVARSARMRTLLPLLRTAMLIVLVTIVAFIVLSELGVDIGPLLAGAGVVGLAIGFGSQALVKDVITGLFILLEDTMAVGEVVDVGGNHIGVVEAISIRTIKLRDSSGTLHTVPFSAVSTVRNMTRDYSYYVADIGVLYSEDPDRVIAVLRQVGKELAEDPAWKPLLPEPLDVVGVEKFTDSAVVIQLRLKTVPLKQWAVGREFNRRLKKAFDAHGIEMPAANQTHYLAPAEAPAASKPSLAPG